MDSHDTPSPRRPAADPAGRLRARALAARRRAELRRRARRIRRSVASLAVVLFLCAFAVVYVQLASGHDPALSTDRRTSSPAATVGAATEGTSRSTSQSGESSSESSAAPSSSGEGESSQGASAVTSSQS
jgi:hypothetical protein